MLAKASTRREARACSNTPSRRRRATITPSSSSGTTPEVGNPLTQFACSMTIVVTGDQEDASVDAGADADAGQEGLCVVPFSKHGPGRRPRLVPRVHRCRYRRESAGVPALHVDARIFHGNVTVGHLGGSPGYSISGRGDYQILQRIAPATMVDDSAANALEGDVVTFSFTRRVYADEDAGARPRGRSAIRVNPDPDPAKWTVTLFLGQEELACASSGVAMTVRSFRSAQNCRRPRRRISEARGGVGDDSSPLRTSLIRGLPGRCSRRRPRDRRGRSVFIPSTIALSETLAMSPPWPAARRGNAMCRCVERSQLGGARQAASVRLITRSALETGQLRRGTVIDGPRRGTLTDALRRAARRHQAIAWTELTVEGFLFRRRRTSSCIMSPTSSKMKTARHRFERWRPNSTHSR